MGRSIGARLLSWLRARRHDRDTVVPRDAPHRPGIRSIAFDCATDMSRRVRSHVIEELVDQLLVFEPTPVLFLGEDLRGQLIVVARRMQQVVERLDADIYSIRASFHEINRSLGLAASEDAKRSLVERYLAETSADRRALRGDLKAVHDHLGFDVLRERNHRMVARLTAAADIAMEIVGGATARSLHADLEGSREVDSSVVTTAASALCLLASRLEHADTWTSRYVAARSMRHIAGAFGSPPARDTIASALDVARSAALDMEEHAWVQAETLQVLLHLDAEAARGVLEHRVVARSGETNPRDFLFRRLAVERSSTLLSGSDATALARNAAVDDPSEHVRIGAVATLACIEHPSAARWLRDFVATAAVKSESSARVRATGVIALVESAARSDNDEDVAGALVSVARYLATEQVGMALGIACDRVPAVAERVVELGVDRFAIQLDGIVLALDDLAARLSNAPGVAERARAAAERIASIVDPELASVVQQTRDLLVGVRPGHSKRFRLSKLPQPLASSLDGPRLGRTLATLTRHDFGVAWRIGQRYLRVWKGDQSRRRAWRVIHEVRNRAPNKRQGWVHTVGRRQRGRFRAPPGRLDEQTSTAVPGERVFVDAEGGWGRHVPLVDDVLDLPVLRSTPVSIYSSYGETRVRPAASLVRRLFNRLRITMRYRDFATERLAALASSEPHQRARYLRMLREGLGVEVTFHPYDNDGRPEPRIPPAVAGLFEVRSQPDGEATE